VQCKVFQVAVRLDTHQLPWRPEILVAINHCPTPNSDKHTCSKTKGVLEIGQVGRENGNMFMMIAIECFS